MNQVNARPVYFNFSDGGFLVVSWFSYLLFALLIAKFACGTFTLLTRARGVTLQCLQYKAVVITSLVAGCGTALCRLVYKIRCT